MTSPRTFELLGRLEHRGPADRYRARVLAPARSDAPAEVALELLDARWDAAAARAIAQDLVRLDGLAHPSLAVSTDLVRLDGRLAIVSPLAPEAAVGRLAPPRSVAVGVAACAADALDAAGRSGVRHGHVDPSAVTLDPRGRVRVHGCGLVRAELPTWSPDTRGLQRDRVVPLPPEQLARARLEPSMAGDVYALGTLLATWWCGAGPGEPRLRRDEHDRAIDRWLATWPLADPPPAAEGVRELVREALAFDPERRPATAAFRDRARTLAAKLTGPGLARWATDHVVSALAMTPVLAPLEPDLRRRALTEAPWRDPTDDPTNLVVRRRGTFAVDPSPTLQPLSEDGEHHWRDLRDDSLAAVAPTGGFSRRPPAGSDESRRLPALGVVALALVVLVAAVPVAGLGIGLALYGPRAAAEGPAVEFRSGLPGGTRRLTVQCGDRVEQTDAGQTRVTLPGGELGPCIVTALDADRRPRTAVVPRARAGLYLCFALDEDQCVEMGRP